MEPAGPEPWFLRATDVPDLGYLEASVEALTHRVDATDARLDQASAACERRHNATDGRLWWIAGALVGTLLSSIASLAVGLALLRAQGKF